MARAGTGRRADVERKAEAVRKEDSPDTARNAGAKRRKRLYAVVMLSFVVWAGITLYSQYGQIQSTSSALAEKQGEERAVKAALKELNLEVERLQDPEYIGQMARKKFGLYPPNEVPIIQPQE
ncbi:septum formation initiator family protein [Paenibacillus sp. JSM ZJ436]|uniref:septum formation initiator family protein n=1 Tax=Paenibacillus sp. JSM ZJ436 TaxID=3376190 RepID=UPI0037963839